MPENKNSGDGNYHLALYIDSESPKCFHVAGRLRQICKQYLSDSYVIEVFDLRDDNSLSEQLRILAVPTLDVTTLESKTHRFVGDLSDSEMFIMAVGMAYQADKMGQEAGKMGKAATEMRNKIKHPE